jgi:hypothetical protein
MPKQRKRLVKYEEGQWFAVPLRNGGYALGIIVRGNFKTKGGLGYFFGPKYEVIPTGEETYSKNKDNALLIQKFGDLGIIEGEWPLIHNSKPFNRDEWPVPLFHRVLPFPEGKALIVEYRQDYSGSESPVKETVVPLTDGVKKLPKDVLSGSGSIEITMTKLIPFIVTTE